MKVPTKPFSDKWQKPDKPYIVADVRYANGADNAFVKQLFEIGFDENFYGYSAWNTSANSLGSLICGAIISWLAQKNSTFNKTNFSKLQTIRFLDDWAYQANVRQELDKPDELLTKEKMKNYEAKVFNAIECKFENINYKFPWNRLFEVEICI